MYKYVPEKERKMLHKECLGIIHSVQDYLRNYFTFDIKLIGSGEARLVTRNNNSEFDLDYNLILQRDKQGLINRPEAIKNLFLEAFNNHKNLFKFAQNSTSVIKSRLVLNNSLYFSFDIAILVEGNNGNYLKLVFDKGSERFIWNEIRNSRNSIGRFKRLKEDGYFIKFKNRYIELKNMHLIRNEDIGSYAIFIETLNDLGY
ncbi:MAG: hypothetical protein FWE36_00060 [Erysipelotrichales bacterium]|nr:hypothetical protein [Erysipelotrichales bacterium]